MGAGWRTPAPDIAQAWADRIRDDALQYEAAAPDLEQRTRSALLNAVGEYDRLVAAAVSELEVLLDRLARQVST